MAPPKVVAVLLKKPQLVRVGLLVPLIDPSLYIAPPAAVAVLLEKEQFVRIGLLFPEE
jgi:hypothetical protein